MLEFFIQDTGIGIPQNRQEAIFERFIQADIEDVQARQGAGLGLSITKAYVEMLGGKIWVNSKIGVGSTFYFTLPYPAKQPIKSEAKTSFSQDNKSNKVHSLVPQLKILIVEDDEYSGMLIDLAVKKIGKKIIKVLSGEEAVKMCHDHSDIDLILMDIQMPEMSGYEAIRQIRQFNKHVVIIAQTAYGLSGDKEKAISAGFNDFISKPYSKIELLSLIQNYFKI